MAPPTSRCLRGRYRSDGEGQEAECMAKDKRRVGEDDQKGGRGREAQGDQGVNTVSGLGSILSWSGSGFFGSVWGVADYCRALVLGCTCTVQ